MWLETRDAVTCKAHCSRRCNPDEDFGRRQNSAAPAPQYRGVTQTVEEVVTLKGRMGLPSLDLEVASCSRKGSGLQWKRRCKNRGRRAAAQNRHAFIFEFSLLLCLLFLIMCVLGVESNIMELVLAFGNNMRFERRMV